MNYSDLDLKKIVYKLINNRCEGDYWDFKEKWHEHIEDLIKDIVCFCNTTHYEDCFIIFGVSDNYHIKGIVEGDKRMTQSDLLDALNSIPFANSNMPDIQLQTINIESDSAHLGIDILIIKNINSTPIYLDRQYGKMKQGCIYARIGDKNTSDNGNANYSQIRELWKKQFNLLRTDLDFVYEELSNKNNWVGNDSRFYHKFRTELTMEYNFECDSFVNSVEFYSYTQTNPSTLFGLLEIKSKGTSIYSRQIASLDSSHLLIPVPEWAFVNNKDNTAHESIAFKYYCKDTILYRLLEFFYDHKNCENVSAFNDFEKVVLFFESNEEKDNFIYGVSCRFDDILKLTDQSTEYNYLKSSFSNINQQDSILKSLRMGLILKEKLEMYRLKGYF